MKKHTSIIAKELQSSELALEEEQLGKTVVEDERCFYAKMESPDVLRSAVGREQQEQWELKQFAEGRQERVGRIRVRKVGIATPEYFITSKIPNPEGAEEETTDKISEDFFNSIKKMSTRGMIKTRYLFDVPGRPEKWEVDVFQTNEGKLCNFVKMDFEFGDGQDKTVPPPPDGFINLISAKTNVPEQREFIKQLYDQVFCATKETGKIEVGESAHETPVRNEEDVADIHVSTIPRDPGISDFQLASEAIFFTSGNHKKETPAELSARLMKVYGAGKGLRQVPGGRATGPLAHLRNAQNLKVAMHSLTQALKTAHEIEKVNLEIYGRVDDMFKRYHDRWDKRQLLKDYTAYQRLMRINIPQGWHFESVTDKGKHTPHGNVVDPSGAYGFVWAMNGESVGDPKLIQDRYILHALTQFDHCMSFGRMHSDDHSGTFSMNHEDAKRLEPECFKLVQDVTDLLGREKQYYAKLQEHGESMLALANANPHLVPRFVDEYFINSCYDLQSIVLQASMQSLRLMSQVAGVIYY